MTWLIIKGMGANMYWKFIFWVYIPQFDATSHTMGLSYVQTEPWLEGRTVIEKEICPT